LSLTSDPHAWLRPFYAKLQGDQAFHHLSPSHQFAALCTAIAVDHPNEAADMGAWSDGAQRALLLHLADGKPSTSPAVPELWRVSKGNRELRCVAQYLASDRSASDGGRRLSPDTTVSRRPSGLSAV
jgi:hypothetical protein